MVRWNAPFEIEEVKQLTLIAALPTHHDPPPPPNESRERESWRANNHETFFNIIGQKRTKFDVHITSGFLLITTEQRTSHEVGSGPYRARVRRGARSAIQR